MISGATPCFPDGNSQGLPMYAMAEDAVSHHLEASSTSETHSNSLLYSLSILKDKVHQVQSLVSIFISPNQSQPEATAIAIASMGTLIQEVIVTASSMMFTCQQMALGATNSGNNGATGELHPHRVNKLPHGGLSQPSCGEERGQGFYSSETIDWYAENNYGKWNTHENNQGIAVSSSTNEMEGRAVPQGGKINEGSQGLSPKTYDIIELDAADLLAKYTHYCQVCGKGFKRDANLRMHMRAHGDEYKSSAALSNPKKNNGSESGNKDGMMKLPRKYSCPHEGCRWNQKHAKFQPLKSMICVKNHYKRSHCPKMYVCKRCNRKQFSVLSDLRTHEKHCGDVKWQCSCGTTFSRKDKLMGHVALFVGHTPAINISSTKPAKGDHQGALMQLDER